MKSIPTIIIDTREKLPLFFDKADDKDNFPDLKTKWGTLKTGDYSILGMDSPDCEHSICLERKSLADLFGSTGNGRERFEREYYRMSKFDYAEVVVENDLRACFKSPPPLSMMHPKSVYRTMVAWSQRYGVGCVWCPNRAFAERHVYISLTRFWEDRQRGGKMEFCKI